MDSEHLEEHFEIPIPPKPNTPERTQKSEKSTKDERVPSDETLSRMIADAERGAVGAATNIWNDICPALKELQSRRTKDEEPSGPFTVVDGSTGAYVCFDKDRNYISREKLCAILNAKLGPVEGLRLAVNNRCSCGGSGPDDDKCCPACHVWHDLNLNRIEGGLN